MLLVPKGLRGHQDLHDAKDMAGYAHDSADLVYRCGKGHAELLQSDEYRGVLVLWAALIARIHKVFPLVCPMCGGQMRIIAARGPPLCDASQTTWMIGGRQVYAEALPLADCVEVTKIEQEFDGDAYAVTERRTKVDIVAFTAAMLTGAYAKAHRIPLGQAFLFHNPDDCRDRARISSRMAINSSRTSASCLAPASSASMLSASRPTKKVASAAVT